MASDREPAGFRSFRWRRACHPALVAALAVSSVACVTNRPVEAPTSEAPVAEGAFVAAYQAEMKNPIADAGYLSAIETAAKAPDALGSLETVIASLHQLASARDIDPGRLQGPIAYRSRASMQNTVAHLRQTWESLNDSKALKAPLMRSFIARSMHELALYSGEVQGANVWRHRRACATTATIVGPITSTPLGSLDAPSSVPDTGAFPADLPGLSELEPRVVPMPVDSDACQIDTHIGTIYQGAFDVVVDIENTRKQKLSFIVSSSGGLSLRVGGKTVVERSFELGGQNTTVMGTAMVGEGIVRAVVRLADRGDTGPIELDVLGEDGLPLKTRAPRTGDVAQAEVGAPTPLPLGIPAAKRAALPPAEVANANIVEAAALLSTGNPRTAEHSIESWLLQTPEMSAPLASLYEHSIEAANDMPDSKRVEAMRRTQAAMAKGEPDSWEAKLLQADLTERRKGAGDGVFAALKELGVSNPTSDISKLDVVQEANVIERSLQAGLNDFAERAYTDLASKSPDSVLAARLDSSLHRRVGPEAVNAACSGGLDRSSSSCAYARITVGDRKGALAEIDRLRELRSAPSAHDDLELQLAIESGDKPRALAIYDAMVPGKRSLLQILPLLSGPADRKEARARVARDVTTARDGVAALVKLGTIFEEPNEDAKKFEAMGLETVRADRKSPALPGAATAVLKHIEHYGLDDNGLLHLFTYDLRRISGTTDVDHSFGVNSAGIDGRGGYYQLRRRIFKKDGRVLEPDATDRSGGSAGDLSQLEQGDYLEVVNFGFFVPSDAGELTIDTPDLMPERTSIKDAEVVFRLPKSFSPPMWAHKSLGNPVVETKDGYKFITYKVTDRGARRLEEGVAPLEQGVRVSLSTETWPKIARGVGEAVRSYQNPDPFVTRFAENAARGEGEAAKDTSDLARVSRLVEQVGRTLKIPNSSMLSDMAGSFGGSQGMTARGMIEDRQGSRSWVIFQSLRALGYKADIAIAESSPWSGSANFPPHTGRFSYPLVVVHLPDGDRWIDADVEGPPLPPGRVSPELRGRNAMLASGDIVQVVTSKDDSGDEVEMALTLDAKATAKGTVAMKLHGRQAQSLSEAFNTVVGSDRREMLRNVVLGWMPWADIDDVRLTSSEGAWEVTITADISVHGFGSPIGRDGHTFVLAGVEPVHSGFGRGTTLAQAYATRGARESALTIDTPVQYRLRRKIELPPGMTVVKSVGAVDVSGSDLSAKRSTSVTGSTITEEFSMSVPTGTIGADQYGAFVGEVESVDAGFLAGIRVKVAP